MVSLERYLFSHFKCCIYGFNHGPSVNHPVPNPYWGTHFQQWVVVRTSLIRTRRLIEGPLAEYLYLLFLNYYMCKHTLVYYRYIRWSVAEMAKYICIKILWSISYSYSDMLTYWYVDILFEFNFYKFDIFFSLLDFKAVINIYRYIRSYWTCIF